MPLYEYECDACGKRFEVIQKFSDPAPEACRVCSKGPVRRLASSPAIQFKGSGFYITDYAKKSTSDSTGSSSAKTDGSKSESGKTDSGSTAAASDSSKSDATKSESPKTDSSPKAEKKSDSGTSS